MSIPFNSLKVQLTPCENDLRAAFERVLGRGWFLMGPEVQAFEAEFAAWAGRGACVALNSGTDALILALRALDCPGGEVVLPAHTALPCYHAVLAAGCTPVFAEVREDTYTLDPASAARMIGPDTRAVLAVHLYGQPCDLDELGALCAARDLPLIEDCAQSHGATYKGRMAGTFGALAAYSFYPTKNLGALGDGGAVCCDAGAVDAALRLERQYGESSRYHSAVPGVNSRMDEMQAAFLRLRLGAWEADKTPRAAPWPRTTPTLLAGHAAPSVPATAPDREHVSHLYVVRAPRREALMEHLRRARASARPSTTPCPGNRQPVVHPGPRPHARRRPWPLSERLAAEVLSPCRLYPGLEPEQVQEVCSGHPRVLITPSTHRRLAPCRVAHARGARASCGGGAPRVARGGAKAGARPAPRRGRAATARR
jgi:dTDP-4-amino-4,6-dideoxygalactose transaminase